MYQEIPFEKIAHLKDQSILIVTATDIETEILHSVLKPISSDGLILKSHNADKTYFIAVFGVYSCFHIQCGTMGSIGVRSSIVTVMDAISLLSPKITIMIGIAFGVDSENQEIGDVLVADTIVPYDNKKISQGETIIRASTIPTSQLLLDKFKNLRDWEHQLNERPAKKIVSPVFSGEELINDIIRRKEIEEINKLAKGGEMEGAGLYAAANGKSEWILVKGICDFADGNKDQNKDENQKIAMRSAVSLCLEVFSSLHAFKSLNLSPFKDVEIRNNEIIFDPLIVNNVLFDIYDIKKEKFYLIRDKDTEITKIINFYSIWISGDSGRGKSISILRNLINSEFEFIQVNLANCLGLSIDDFFFEIYVEILSILDSTSKIDTKKDYQDSIRKINSLLNTDNKGKTIFILIDEIPLGNDEKFSEFVQKICSLFITSSQNINGTNIRFALSSIYSPENHIPEFQNKVRANLQFVKIENWTESECMELISLIENELNFKLVQSSKELIINQSNGSPRWIKNVLKNLIMLGDFSEKNVEVAISHTKSQNVK